jgi:subtilase family serine protease
MANRRRWNFLAVLVSALVLFVSDGAESEQMAIMAGNHPVESTDLTRVAPPGMILHIKIMFAVRNREGLEKLLSELQNPSSPNYHHWLTSREFESRFGQPKNRIQAVRRWLASNGFHVSRVDANEIAADASVAQVEKTFSVSIVTSEDRSRYANRNDPSIPARFASVISFIDGLDNLRRAVPQIVRGQLVSGSYYFKPSDFSNFYNEIPLFNAGIDGRSLAHPKPGPPRPYGAECGIALAEESDFLDSAISTFTTTFSLPPLYNIGAYAIRRIFPAGNPGRNGNEAETLLDIEWAHAVAPGAVIWVYISGDLTSAINQAISDNRCGVISISFSFCGASSGFYQNLDSSFSKAVAQGQSVFVSSGDQGAAGLTFNGSVCVTATTGNVNEMAASPNATAVGGTQFTPTYDANGNVSGVVPESTWNDVNPDTNWAGSTGGGQSVVFPKPNYQQGVTPADGQRDLPDVAFGASSFQPGFYTFGDNNGQPSLGIYGGTSIATPMWAGVARLISQKARAPGTYPRAPNPRLGNMNPEIYKLGALARGFRDVTYGNNNFNSVPGFSAGPNYDQTTGWGTLDITTFVNAYTADICPHCP